MATETEDKVPWTTTRCNRLLRPIASRLATLRKAAEGRQDGGRGKKPPRAQPQPSREQTRTEADSRAEATAPAAAQDGTPDHDPDWMPTTKSKGSDLIMRRPVKCSYGGRNKTRQTRAQEHAAAQPEAGINLPTPFRPRALPRSTPTNPHPMSAAIAVGPREARRQIQRFKEEMEDLKMNMSPGSWGQVDRLTESFVTLLTSTGAKASVYQAPVSRPGTRSLHSTCLRQVPTYIALEEYWQEEDDPDNEADVATEIYEDLESMALDPSQGFKPLRDVVRAHGVRLLCDGFVDGIIPLKSIDSFVNVCMRVSAWDEAEQFLIAYLAIAEPMAPPFKPGAASLFERRHCPCLATVQEFCKRSHRPGFLYRSIAQLLLSGKVPLEWLATSAVASMWGQVIRSISAGDAFYADAVTLFDTAVLLSAGVPKQLLMDGQEIDDSKEGNEPPASVRMELQHALADTIRSITTVLSTIVLISHQREDIDQSTEERTLWPLQNVITSLTTIANTTHCFSTSNLDTSHNNSSVILTAGLLLHASGCKLPNSSACMASSSIIHTINGLRYEDPEMSTYPGRERAESMDCMTEFIAAVARCCGEAWKDNGFDQLQRLVNSLIDPVNLESAGSSCSWFVQRLALESAMIFAKQQPSRDHLDFVSAIEEAVQDSAPDGFEFAPVSHSLDELTSSPVSEDGGRARVGFRWDAGICEWVSKTPYAKQQVRRQQARPIGYQKGKAKAKEPLPRLPSGSFSSPPSSEAIDVRRYVFEPKYATSLRPQDLTLSSPSATKLSDYMLQDMSSSPAYTTPLPQRWPRPTGLRKRSSEETSTVDDSESISPAMSKRRAMPPLDSSRAAPSLLPSQRHDPETLLGVGTDLPPSYDEAVDDLAPYFPATSRRRDSTSEVEERSSSSTPPREPRNMPSVFDEPDDDLGLFAESETSFTSTSSFAPAAQARAARRMVMRQRTAALLGRDREVASGGGDEEDGTAEAGKEEDSSEDELSFH